MDRRNAGLALLIGVLNGLMAGFVVAIALVGCSRDPRPSCPRKLSDGTPCVGRCILAMDTDKPPPWRYVVCDGDYLVNDLGHYEPRGDVAAAIMMGR